MGRQQHQWERVGLLGEMYSIFRSMRVRHVEAGLPAYSAALIEN